jgi:hypothetical protein
MNTDSRESNTNNNNMSNNNKQFMSPVSIASKSTHASIKNKGNSSSINE